MNLTKGQITTYALAYLSVCRYDCWRNNNATVARNRHFIGRLGVPDIAGISRDNGKAMYCEVKAKGDKFTQEQVDFLNNLTRYGGHACVAYEHEEGAKVSSWQLYSMIFKINIRKTKVN